MTIWGAMAVKPQPPGASDDSVEESSDGEPSVVATSSAVTSTATDESEPMSHVRTMTSAFFES